MSPEQIDPFISAHKWTFAKTMAHIPHSYVVRNRVRDEAEFERFVLHIRTNGYQARFGWRTFTYFDWMVADVLHQFWTMGAPLERTIIINRAVKRMTQGQ
jgi:hypothetical protein